MLCKMILPCSLIITQCAGIFLVFMSRLDMSVEISIAGVFSATLVTLVLDLVMDTVNVPLHICLLDKLFTTIWATKPFSKMLRFIMGIARLFGIKMSVTNSTKLHFDSTWF